MIMDNPGSSSLNGDDNIGIPEDLRCKRSDGKQWRCSAMSMPDKTVCEKHYIQAKKRAANSALRASMKKAKRKTLGESDVFLTSKNGDLNILQNGNKNNHNLGFRKKHKEKPFKNRLHYSPETHVKNPPPARNVMKQSDESKVDSEQLEENWRPYPLLPPSDFDSPWNASQRSTEDEAPEEYSDRSTDASKEIGGHSCHQCRRLTDTGEFTWCQRCCRRGYCFHCISSWYSDIPVDEIERICPACRGICNCKICLQGDNLVKIRIKDIPFQNKLFYLYTLLSSVLPVVKHIHNEQCSEVEFERKLCGTVADLSRIKLNADEQMCCDFCRIPIIDYHRHCDNCSYDLCLSCFKDIREEDWLSDSMSPENEPNLESQGVETVFEHVKISKRNPNPKSHRFPEWSANCDGRIPCPPEKYGGCGSSLLILRRIFKLNWVAKLAKRVEEMVSGCKVFDEGHLQNVRSLFKYADREDESDNLLYCPKSYYMKGDIESFREHWMRGEPVLVRDVFDNSVDSCWDPILLLREIEDMDGGKIKDEHMSVKAVNCFDSSEVDVDLIQFIHGYYSGGRTLENGYPEMLKLKNWPSPGVCEEFLMFHRSEFISKIPLLEYIHSKWGFINVAAKLPHYSLQNDTGPKIVMCYGSQEDSGHGNPVANIHVNTRDMVFVLVHSSKTMPKGSMEDVDVGLEDKSSSGLLTGLDGMSADNSVANNDAECEDYATVRDTFIGEENNSGNKPASCEIYPAVFWDVFRRQDIPKLNEYLSEHLNEFGQLDDVAIDHPLHSGKIFLDEENKTRLKEQYGIEPWFFGQRLGEAVFVPAGCPVQIRNVQSTVQISLDFLLPESLAESVRLAGEIRSLPNNHESKLQVLEVEKMCLYAASCAIKDVQKLVLDSKAGVEEEIGCYHDPNMTAKVSENLEKMVGIVCT